MKSKKASVWIWIVFILVVIAVASGVFFFVKKNADNNSQSNLDEQSNQQNSDNQSNTNEDKQSLEVSKIQEPIEFNCVDWNGDSEGDGLIMYSLAPKDSDDRPVKAEGELNVKLWKKDRYAKDPPCVMTDENLLEEWNIPIIKTNYNEYGEAQVKLEYQNFRPTSDMWQDGWQSCAEVVFTTDSTSFNATDQVIFTNLCHS